MREFLAVTKALSDESRVRALLSIKDGELCLCQIVDVLGLSPATVSKHMTLLYQAGLVQRRKDGKWQFYRLSGREGTPTVRRALKLTLQELAEDATIRKDEKRVRKARTSDLEELSGCYRR